MFFLGIVILTMILLNAKSIQQEINYITTPSPQPNIDYQNSLPSSGGTENVTTLPPQTNQTNISLPINTPPLTNLIQNGDFLTALPPWDYHKSMLPNYASWVANGHDDAGALHMTPINSSNTATEIYQGVALVDPGDKIIYEGWFKSGDYGIPSARNGYLKWNNGVGLGIDFREAFVKPSTGCPTGSYTSIGDYCRWNSIIYTLNGPATLNQNWTKLHVEQVIPCLGARDAGITTYNVSSGVSTTGGTGAGAGLTVNWTVSPYPLNVYSQPFNGQPLPKMQVTPWLHIWHGDTVTEGYYDNIKLFIIRNFTSCP